MAADVPQDSAAGAGSQSCRVPSVWRRAFVNVMLLVVGWGPRLLLIPSLSCADTAAGGEGPYSRSRAMRRAISGHPMHSRDESHRLICQWSARAGPLAWASTQVVGTMLNRTACVKQHDAPGSGRRYELCAPSGRACRRSVLHPESWRMEWVYLFYVEHFETFGWLVRATLEVRARAPEGCS